MTENLTMAKRAESACAGNAGKIYLAQRGPDVYGNIYNSERSRLEFILFNNRMNDHIFMRDIRYLWNDLDILLTKIVKRTHTANWLRESKKAYIMPKSIEKAINTLYNVGQNNHKIMVRIRTMSYEMLNNMISKNDMIRFKLNRYMNITWRNLCITLNKAYGRDPEGAILIIGKYLRNKMFYLNKNLNRVYENRLKFKMEKKTNIQGYTLEMNIVTNEGNLIPEFERKFNNMERVPGENQTIYYKKVLLRIKFDKESFIIHKNEQNRNHNVIKNIEEVNNFLENKGPTYSVRNAGPEKTIEEFKNEFNKFLIRIRHAENPNKTSYENKEVKDKIVVPFENRRVYLPEEIGYIKEGKLCEAYNRIANVINIETNKDAFLRKRENQKITQMRNVLKKMDFVLVTTDKTKRTLAISKGEYIEAGNAFLADNRNYCKLEKDSSDKIENLANKLIKRIKPSQELNKADLEKLLMVGSKPANFFLNVKDYKGKNDVGKYPIRPIASVHGTPVDGIDFLIQLILKQTLSIIPTNCVSNRHINEELQRINEIVLGINIENNTKILEKTISGEIYRDNDLQSETALDKYKISFESYIEAMDGKVNKDKGREGPVTEKSDNLHKKWKNTSLGIMSLDVVNLYPSIPLWDGINKVMTMITECETIKWYGISKKLLKDMLHCICFNYEIRFFGNVFKQKQGVPMGARFAPPFAIIYLFMLERNIINKCKGILFFKRYIDDILVVYDKNITEPVKILEEFNKLDNNIKFTMETPKIGEYLAFLDLEIKVNKGLLETRWFMKPIHSMNMIHFESATLIGTKLNILTNMFVTCIINSNTKENIKYSTKKLGKVIEKNGYPIIDIENCIRRAFYKVNNLEKEDKQKFTLGQFIKVPAISHFFT